MNGPQRIVLGAWLALIGIATAKSLSAGRGLPQPGVFLGGALLMSGYYVLAEFLGGFPAVLAVGTDLAVVAYPYIQGRVPAQGQSFLDRVNAGLVGINQSQATAGTLRPGQPS